VLLLLQGGRGVVCAIPDAASASIATEVPPLGPVALGHPVAPGVAESSRLEPPPGDEDVAENKTTLLQLLHESARQYRRGDEALPSLSSGGGDRRRLQGAALDAPWPRPLVNGVFVLDLERHAPVPGTNVSRELTPHLGVFVGKAEISFDTKYTGAQPDDAAIQAQGNGERSLYTNTTVAEVHYKVLVCPNAVLAPDKDLCQERFTTTDDFRTHFFGSQGTKPPSAALTLSAAGHEGDRGRGDGIFYTGLPGRSFAKVGSNNPSPGLIGEATWDKPDYSPITESFAIELGRTSRSAAGGPDFAAMQVRYWGAVASK
jgi:hypothetical protein